MSTTDASRHRPATEIVDNAIQLVRRNYLPLITVAAVGYLPFTVILMTVFRREVAAVGTGTVLAMLVLPMPGLRVAAYYAFVLLWSALIDLSLTVAVSDAYWGRLIDTAAVFRRALPRAGPTLIALIIKYSLIPVGGLLCLLPLVAFTRLTGPPESVRLFLTGAFLCLVAAGACYTFARLFAATAGIVLEHTGPVAALRRSAKLSRHRGRHVVGGLALAYGLYLVCVSPVILLAADRVPALIPFLSVGASILLVPILTATRVLLYYDARDWSEGFDVERIAQSTGVHAKPI